MGRDIVLAKIKKGGITAVVGGAVLMLIFGLITIGVMSDNADDGMGMIVWFICIIRNCIYHNRDS